MAVPLRELLAACVSVSEFAGQVIRGVVRDGTELDVVNKAEQGAVWDPQTVADRRSQQRIVHALRRQWPHVQIVGEEGELEEPEAQDVVEADVHALDTAVFTLPDNLRELDPEQLVLWIDPLDGTKKFAEKKYEEVSVLIGIAYKKRPIAGVVHLPFHGPVGMTYWGGPGIGLFLSKQANAEAPLQHEAVSKPTISLYPARGLHVTISSTECGLVNETMRELAPVQTSLGGATGTMVLNVLTGHSDLFFRFKAATKRWDICAVEPLIEALGGSLTDKHGHVYEYDPHGDPAFDNAYGLIVCLEPETHKQVLATMTKIQVLRALHGRQDCVLLTSEWLQTHVLKAQGSLVSTCLLPGSVHRGRHATVAKLQLQYSQDAAGSMKPRSKTLFIKRSVKQELQPRPEAQWTRDLCSYRNESRFYALFHGDLQAHVPLITPYAVLSDAHAIDGSAFLLVMDCLDEKDEADATTKFIHVDSLGANDTQQALLYLARLHSAAWGNAPLLALASQQLWASGGWWTFAKRGLSPLQQNAPRIWRELLCTLEVELGAAGIDVDAPSIATLGDRLVAQAEYIQQQLSSESLRALRTLMHGDFKSANLFFEARSREVVAFDWQWTGVGLGAMDVAYLLATSASIAVLETEQQLLQFYFDALRNKPADYSFAQFQRHYVLATLEYAHILMARFWNGLSPATCAAKAGNTNCGLGYRSLPHVLRLVQSLDQGLAMVEREQR